MWLIIKKNDIQINQYPVHRKDRQGITRRGVDHDGTYRRPQGMRIVSLQ